MVLQASKITILKHLRLASNFPGLLDPISFRIQHLHSVFGAYGDWPEASSNIHAVIRYQILRIKLLLQLFQERAERYQRRSFKHRVAASLAGKLVERPLAEVRRHTDPARLHTRCEE